MADKNEVFEIIKSLITSQKGGVLLKDINRDYINLAGSHVPYKTLGYRSIEELLKDIPEVESYMNDNGQLVLVNKGKNCEHLVKLVSKQKGARSSKLKQSYAASNIKPRRPRNSDIGVYEYDRNKEKENYAKGLDRSGVDDFEDIKKRSCVQSIIHEPKTTMHPRKSMGDCFSNPHGQRTKRWKTCQPIQESVQLEHDKEDIYDQAVDDRAHHYKPSLPVRRRESFHGFSKTDHREVDGLCDFMDELLINKGSDNYYGDNFYKSDRSASSLRSKSIRAERCDPLRSKSVRAERCDPLMGIPNASHGDDGFKCSASGSHFKHLQSQKYRNHGSSKYEAEFDDWVAEDYDQMSYGRTLLDKRSRSDNHACDHPGRKIDLISGSLRVTIKNC